MALVVGTNGADSLSGTAGETNAVYGYSGDDSLYGAELDDTFQSERGDDYIVAYGGNDSVYAGDGDDEVHALAGNDYVFADDGHDDVFLGEGDDTVLAGEGDDAVDAYGLLGETNTIRLDAGDDAVWAGLGADLIDGGRGQDVVYHYGSSAAVTVNLRSGVGAGGKAEGDTYRFVEDVVGSNFNDVLIGNGVSNVLDGDEGNDRINGGIGADFLYGDNGADTLDYTGSSAEVIIDLATGLATGGDALGDEFFDFENVLGSSFADKLTGDAAANRLSGANGTDMLAGALGADLLAGGSGGDRFIYRTLSESTVAAGGRDRILDFSPAGGDRIDLSAIDADAGLGGNQAFGFIGTGPFTGSGNGGEVRYQQVAGATFVYADVNGDRTADLSIRLDSLLTLTASGIGSDFVL